jgi:hypothetical protein
MKILLKILVLVICVTVLSSCVASNEVLTLTSEKWTFASWSNVPLIYKSMIAVWYFMTLALPLMAIVNHWYQPNGQEALLYNGSLILIYCMPCMILGIGLIGAMWAYQIIVVTYHATVTMGFVVAAVIFIAVGIAMLKWRTSFALARFFVLFKIIFYLTMISAIGDVAFLIYWYFIK